MQLSKRLKAVAECVTKGNIVADIGCDHAYTSIYLMENRIASNVIAMDINKGPLERANENIKKAGFENVIETRLSDGANKLEQGEADTILIAGMGGNLMVKILSDSSNVVENVTELILQPQSEVYLVRKYIHSIGFSIIYEDMMIDEGKYYVIIKAEKKVQEKYTNEVHYLYGKLLLEGKNIILKEWLDKEYQKTKDILENLIQKDTEHAKDRVEELNTKLQYIIEGMNYYE
jgi:tRNA (adenine22-N1)-methyltransferase